MLGRGLWAGLLAGVIGIGCGDEPAAPPQPPQDSAQTRAIMREIFAGLQVALPASAEPEHFSDPTRRGEIQVALDSLASHTEQLESHARERDAQLRFLARSVARDASDADRAFREGNHRRAAFLLRQISENCIVCHTRLPSAEDSPITRGFVDESALASLPPEPRASLLIATRRFDAALDTLEELLTSSAEHPALLLGPLTDYLVVNLRVKDDYERPVATLERFAEREDLWERLRADVEAWIAALPALHERTRGEPDLETARALLAEARSQLAFPEDRASLAHFVAASAILERFIDTHPEPDAELAEAFYQLGLIEARIGRNYWVTPAPFLLETSIRLGPSQPFARDAFERLEQELFLSYEGSDEEGMPAEEQRRLDELRALLEAG